MLFEKEAIKQFMDHRMRKRQIKKGSNSTQWIPLDYQYILNYILKEADLKPAQLSN